ncbi:CatB-related O-acetyltransferase [Laribacter hongkongensis]|uniref:CatB-related O-acetyltransferase n=1 Tax=Laribacter hongkongensis TaxID=168471 RepID=UPI001EFC80DF|nr:CatB-related O-acetyltransferase [Laribacter hongkongensis]MCG9022851.1 CatB-related O-acetyltransferase [Laribacter hongkongensis]
MLRYLISKLIKKVRLASICRSSIHPTAKVEAGTAFIDSVMGRHSFCGYDCEIYRATIGAFTSIANGVVLGGARHPMEWVGMSPVFYAGRDSIKAKFAEHMLSPPAEVTVGNDVWIGRSAIVLSGVEIGNGAVVGAGAVVTKDVPPYAIVAGNPAKIIRYRFREPVIQALEKLQWWNFSDQRLSELGRHFNNVSEFLAVVDGSEQGESLIQVLNERE